MKRIEIDRKYYRVARANHGEDPCELCHFTNDAVDNCPRMRLPYQERAPLYCSHHDEFGSTGIAYLIRDTKQGNAEWVARKMGVTDE